METGRKGGQCGDREERMGIVETGKKRRALYRQGRKGGHCIDREEKAGIAETGRKGWAL